MLKIIKAKPNPAGLDKFGRNIIPALKLAGEWVDVVNEGNSGISLNGLQVYHYAYKGTADPQWEKVITFSFGDKDVLLPGKVLRVHSGGDMPENQLLEVDKLYADYHVFTGKNYVWNNSQKDYPRIWNPTTEKWIDQTWYEAYPPDGAILKRIGEKLT